MKQSLAPVSNKPFNFTPLIVIFIDEGLRTPTLHNPGFDFLDAANIVLSDDCLDFLQRFAKWFRFPQLKQVYPKAGHCFAGC